MTPIAKFIYVVSGLTVNLTDKTDNVPTSWLWDFGDSLGTSIVQNPVYVYANAGTYPITLTVSNADGVEVITQNILISPDNIFDIDTIIAQEFPTGFTLDPAYIATRKQYWQLYLQTIVEPKIPDSNVFNEDFWPPLVNMLISKLIIYDYLVKLAQEAMVTTIGGGTTTTTGTGNIKTMEMGPSKAEWYDSATTIKELFGSTGGNPSTFSLTQGELCSLAKRLRIFLPMCGALSKPIIGSRKATKPCIPSAIMYLQRIADNYPTL